MILTMKTMLYLVSGSFKNEYINLPFDSMYFINSDRALKKSFQGYPNRVKFIGKDALCAIDVLKKDGVKIDYLVVINEGLYEGGASYPIFSDFLMGYLSPILKDEFILITDLQPYLTTHYKALTKLDFGVLKIEEVLSTHPKYIAPSLFTEYYHTKDVNFGQVFVMKKVKQHSLLSLFSSKFNVSLVHGSIWHDELDLDFIGLNLNNSVPLRGSVIRGVSTSKDFFLSKTNVHNIYGLSMKEIIQQAESQGSIKIGIVPWGYSDYSYTLPFLSQLETKSIKEIRFYHLNASDFSAIYEGYAQMIIQEYPHFFSNFLNNNHLLKNFHEVIKKGAGDSVLKLCELIDHTIDSDREVFNFSFIKWESNTFRISSRTQNQYIIGLIRMCEETLNK
jgi:hypothetical protein